MSLWWLVLSENYGVATSAATFLTDPRGTSSEAEYAKALVTLVEASENFKAHHQLCLFHRFLSSSTTSAITVCVIGMPELSGDWGVA